MKQVLQNIKNGQTEVASVPVPSKTANRVLIKTRKSLISAGTERMLVDFGRSGWVAKARQQPDKVKMVLEKVKTDGLMATVDAVSSKLDQPLPLGYSNVGVVSEVGEDVSGLSHGDRVVSNGHHAEVVAVPQNLIARIPDAVSDEHAAFTVLAAIGLQGIRLAEPTLGEYVVVTGLGLIGLLTVQMLKSNGCRVLGIDLDASRLALARSFGAETVDLGKGEDVVAAANRFTQGRGVDAVLITASTSSSEPVSQAATICRKRGRIVLVGVTGLELSRDDFFEKELSFQVSCSYGPGRYDKSYEEDGRDYPYGFVRWTEQRNFEAVLDLMAEGRLDIDPLITHRFSIDDAEGAYQTLIDDNTSLGILLDYGDGGDLEISADDRSVRTDAGAQASEGSARIAVIGSGNYSGRVLIPALQKLGAHIETLVSSGGVSAAHHARKVGAGNVSTNPSTVFDDPGVDLVVVATRHDSHSELVAHGLQSGKSVFVEKPLCLTLEELSAIETAYQDSRGLLMIGFNRRFAPLVVQARDLLQKVDGPKTMSITVNAGAIPADHWTRDPAVGGGRIVGEGCHFIDLLRFFAGCPIADHQTVAIHPSETSDAAAETAIINLKFADGSLGTVQYITNGHRSFPKERVEIFCAGRVLRIDNYRRLESWGWPGFRRKSLWKQDKGQTDCLRDTLRAVETGAPSPIAAEEIFEVSRVSIEIAENAC